MNTDEKQMPLFGAPVVEKKRETFLFFDTETTGLPLRYNAPLEDLNNWPRLVQLAWILYSDDGVEISRGDSIIKPDGFIIPAESTRVHGITTERADKEGVSIAIVLEKFAGLIRDTTYVIAHNYDFDRKIIGSEFLRNNMKNALDSKKSICTMTSTVEFCAIPSSRGFKWPKLSELHVKLFGEDFKEAHNASVDISATAKCFWELKRRGVL